MVAQWQIKKDVKKRAKAPIYYTHKVPLKFLQWPSKYLISPISIKHNSKQTEYNRIETVSRLNF